MRMQEIMSSPPETIAPGTAVAEARAKMKREGIHHLIVSNRGQIVGVLSARDLIGAGREMVVSELMASRVVTASPRNTVRDAANLLRGRGVGCLPIVERGRAVGMVTITDLLELIGKGTSRPVAESTRWTLKARGPRRARPSRDRSSLEYTR
jgi:acetoin utilization protein AcuB